MQSGFGISDSKRVGVVDVLLQTQIPGPTAARLDAICDRVRDHYGVKAAMISVIAPDGNHYVSKSGMDVSHSPAQRTGYSFCHYGYRRKLAVVILDAQEDERFATNALVVGPPHIRFYAGQPIDYMTSQGPVFLGCLGILDERPRKQFFTWDCQLLEECAREVMDIFADVIAYSSTFVSMSLSSGASDSEEEEPPMRSSLSSCVRKLCADRHTSADGNNSQRYRTEVTPL